MVRFSRRVSISSIRRFLSRFFCRVFSRGSEEDGQSSGKCALFPHRRRLWNGIRRQSVRQLLCNKLPIRAANRHRKKSRKREKKRERERQRQRQTDGGGKRGGRGERDRERKKEKHVTRGYNIVADRWTEAPNLHPHPNPNPHTEASRPLVFPLFHSDGQMDRWMDWWTMPLIESGVEMRERLSCQDAQSSPGTFQSSNRLQLTRFLVFGKNANNLKK